MKWYKKVLRQYADFSGRAQRKEYWMFMLFHVLIAMAFGAVDTLIGTWDSDTGYGLFTTLYNLAVLVPLLAVSVRRLHDTGRSAWWYLIWLIPGIGWLIFLVFMVLDSEQGENEYGPNPKKSTVARA